MRIRARQQHVVARIAARAGAARGRQRPTYLGLLLTDELPAVGPATPSVRIMNPDGSLRECITAEEFRRRSLETARSA